ncbi:YPO3983 family protein [Erwinia aphidicola]|uniref:YPO3983 family protein n=1 Tax=Erwinia aphidicola TaxID=68334 RepID=UPI0030CCC518
MLFDEFRQLSRVFSLYGPYKSLIESMINHMQSGEGKAFSSIYLDVALKEQIERDSTENSTSKLLRKAIKERVDWEKRYFPQENREYLTKAILGGKLPKFDRFVDNFNGMGISVHDTWATHITLKSLKINNDSYRAVVHYKVQDHFGLDGNDILNIKYRQLRFFRIWFVLQRYNKLAFKPFMTNMEASVVITGGRNDGKK